MTPTLPTVSNHRQINCQPPPQGATTNIEKKKMADTTTAKTGAAAAAAGGEKEGEFPKNHIRVSPKKSKFLYVDITKYLLNEGETFVDISGLGSAIAEVVDIVEVLKGQGLVKAVKIETSRTTTESRRPTDRLIIRVVKAPTFDKVFAEQQAMKEARKAATTEVAATKA